MKIYFISKFSREAVQKYMQGMDKNIETPNEIHAEIDWFILAKFVSGIILYYYIVVYTTMYNLCNMLQVSFVVETLFCLVVSVLLSELICT